jgi:hypothetical protein
MRRSITKVILRYPSYLTTDAPFDSRWDSISFTLSLCPYFSAPVCRRHMHALTSSCTGWLRYKGTTDRDCPWLYSHDRLPLDILLPASSYGIACRVSHSTSLLSSLILLCNKQLLYSISYGIKREVQGCEPLCSLPHNEEAIRLD